MKRCVKFGGLVLAGFICSGTAIALECSSIGVCTIQLPITEPIASIKAKYMDNVNAVRSGEYTILIINSGKDFDANIISVSTGVNEYFFKIEYSASANSAMRLEDWSFAGKLHKLGTSY